MVDGFEAWVEGGGAVQWERVLVDIGWFQYQGKRGWLQRTWLTWKELDCGIHMAFDGKLSVDSSLSISDL